MDKHIKNIYDDGYTLIQSLISHETCDKLKIYLDKKFNTNLPYNYSKGHYQIHLPENYEDFPKEIVLNETIHKIINGIFEDKYYMYSYTCNANLADLNQPYHMDCSHFHSLNTIKKFGSPGPPVQLIVNIYLQDTDETNGTFEIVPKSHLSTDFKIDEDGIIDPKYVHNTVKCNLPKGSVIIRDKRTWHCGTKNESKKIRYMVGTSYSLNWYKLNELYFDQKCSESLYFAPFSTWNIKYNLENY
jgi:hypothetical protein